jgi:DNA-binding LacI/PurR family transcriptional regulator
MAQALRRHGLHTLSFALDKVTTAQLRAALDERPAGVIACHYDLGDADRLGLLAAARAQGLPVVVYGDAADLPDYDTVSADHERATYELTRLLIARGRRRLLRVWDRNWGGLDRLGPWFAPRNAGYERACREAGIEPLPAVELYNPLRYDWTEPSFRAMTRLVAGYLVEHVTGPAPVDGILAASDGCVPFVAAACRILGKEPQRDVAIVGYDNYWADIVERRWEPTAPLATVDKQNERLGAALAELLVERREGRLPDAPQHRLVEAKLVESCGNLGCKREEVHHEGHEEREGGMHGIR